MPKVQTYGGRKVRTAPVPGARRQAHETFESQGGQVATAVAGVGASTARFAINTYSQIKQLEADRAVQVENLTTLRRLEEEDQRLLHDPEQGMLTKRGLAVHEGMTGALEDYDKRVGEIGASLKTDRARLYYEQEKIQRRARNVRSISMHGERELTVHEEKETNATLASLVNGAIANPTDLERIAQNRAQAHAILDTHGQRIGLGPEARTAAKENIDTQIHAGVVKRFLAIGNTTAAREYFEEVQTQIKDEAVETQLAAQLKAASSDDAGFSAAQRLIAELAPTDDRTPIAIDKMEQRLRDEFKNDPAGYKAALSFLHDWKRTTEDGRKAREGQRLDDVWTAVANQRPLAEVSKLPAFLALEGKEQTAVREFYRRDVEHDEQLAYTRTQRKLGARGQEEHERELNGWSTYWELSDPETLRKLTRGDIMAKRGELGHAHVQRLILEKEQIEKSDAAFRTAGMDRDAFMDVARNAGLTYVDTPAGQQSKAQRAALGRLEATVKQAIAREQDTKKRRLTLDEQLDVAQKIVDRKVMMDDWGYDTPTIAAVVDPADREQAYVPLAEIPKSALQEALTYLRRHTPRLADTPDNMLTAGYRKRIERAYALTILGGTRAEVEAILRGEQ